MEAYMSVEMMLPAGLFQRVELGIEELSLDRRASASVSAMSVPLTRVKFAAGGNPRHYLYLLTTVGTFSQVLIEVNDILCWLECGTPRWRPCQQLWLA